MSAPHVRKLAGDGRQIAVHGAEIDDAFNRRNDAGLYPSVR